MKKIISAFMLALVCMTGFAQNAAKDIYTRYSGREGVSSVYVSPAMFKLIRKLPDLSVSGENVNLTNIVKELEGLYILNTDEGSLGKALSEDAEKMIRSGKLEVMMEANEGGTKTRMYVAEKDGIVSELVLYTKEPGEVTLISVCGKMRMEDLAGLLED